MVMPSSSLESLCNPHIGSLGGEGFFAARPESQCPAALPTQQGIVDLLAEAPAIGTNVVRNDRATSIATKIFPSQRRKGAKDNPSTSLLLCVFAGNIFINLIRTGEWFLNRFLHEFHFALGTRAAFFGRDRLMHRAYIVKLDWLFRVSRTFFLRCRNDSGRIQACGRKKQSNRKQRHD